MKKLKRLFPDTLTVKKSLYAKRMFGFAAAGAGFAALYQPAEAQIIIQDSFTSGSSYSSYFNGKSPSGTGHTDLPGGTYLLEGGAGVGNAHVVEYSNANVGGRAVGTVRNFANVSSSGVGAAISLQTGGSYVEPTTLEYAVTVDPDANNNAGTTNVGSTARLGFYTTASSSAYSSASGGVFLGLTLDGNGNLNYSSSSGSGLIDAAGTGIFNSSGFTTLSYQLAFNTGTDIATFSNILLNGASVGTSYTTGSLSANSIHFVGFGVSNDTTNTPGAAISSFEISGVAATPEPSTEALLAGGVLALGAYQYHRRRYGI